MNRETSEGRGATVPDPSQVALPAARSGFRCTIVVPCYNEARRFPTQAFRDFLETTQSIRFLFVNDGSRDATLDVLEALRLDFTGQIEIFDKQKNGGKGEAVREGMLSACQQPETPYIAFWDADLATPLNLILPMLDHLDDSPTIQMVFGSRIRLLGRYVHRKASRHYLGRIFATVVSQMIRLPIYDTQCGSKVFRNTSDLATVLADPFISRWIFDVEIIARYTALHRADPEFMHRSIYEFPLDRWEDIAGSKIHKSDFLFAFLDILRIRRKYFS